MLALRRSDIQNSRRALSAQCTVWLGVVAASPGARAQPGSVGIFTGVDPVVIDVDGLGEDVGVGLEILQAYSARHTPRVPRLVPIGRRGVDQSTNAWGYAVYMGN